MQKLSKTAIIKDNAQVKRDLDMIKYAIKNGALDSIFTLCTWKDDKSCEQRNMTISEIDAQIERLRQDKIDSIDFAHDQMNLFSQYLKRNFKHSSSDSGYTPGMILKSITERDFASLLSIVAKQTEIITNDPHVKSFVDGQSNKYDGTPLTKAELITSMVYQTLREHELDLEAAQ